MSELVKKVAREIVESMGDTPESAARAAIAAVAEWIAEHHQIDKDGSVHLALTWQYAAKAAPTPPEVK